MITMPENIIGYSPDLSNLRRYLGREGVDILVRRIKVMPEVCATRGGSWCSHSTRVTSSALISTDGDIEVLKIVGGGGDCNRCENGEQEVVIRNATYVVGGRISNIPAGGGPVIQVTQVLISANEKAAFSAVRKMLGIAPRADEIVGWMTKAISRAIEEGGSREDIFNAFERLQSLADSLGRQSRTYL